MLIIKTEVRQSSIHGTGLFTLEPLKKGQLIWVCHKNFDCMFTKTEWDLLPIPARNYLFTYMYWSENHQKYVACLDNSRYMNHSVNPNTESIFYNNHNAINSCVQQSGQLTSNQWAQIDVSEGFVVTSRSIDAEEELLCNYELDFPDRGGANTTAWLSKSG